MGTHTASESSGMNIHEMVDYMAAVLYSDSHVRIDKQALTEALDQDLGNNGIRPLTEEEINLFIEGNDDGEIPEHLTTLYPKVQELITSYF